MKKPAFPNQEGDKKPLDLREDPLARDSRGKANAPRFSGCAARRGWLIDQRLRAANRALGCDFFEGVVMKRANSIYPVQMRSATEEFRGWVKHPFFT